MQAEPASIRLIDDDAASEDGNVVFFRQSYGQFLPVQKVCADCVAPAHVTPGIAKGIVLIEEMVFAFEEDEAVGVVGPVSARGEVKLRAQGLIVGGLRE